MFGNLQNNAETELHAQNVALARRVQQLEHQEELYKKRSEARQAICALIAQVKPIEETLQHICDIVLHTLDFPQYAQVRISFDGVEYESSATIPVQTSLRHNFVTFDNNTGSIEVLFARECMDNPANEQTQRLLVIVASLICGYLNDAKGRLLSMSSVAQPHLNQRTDIYRNALQKKTQQPLQQLLNKQILDKYIYLNMMKIKVREILFVATLYDAYNLEKDDSFFEKFMGPIYQYSIFSLPRIIASSSHEEALELLEHHDFDLVVCMVGAEVQHTLELTEKIRAISTSLPIYLLLNQNANIPYFEKLESSTNLFNQTFVWNGDSQLFFAMVKSLEDYLNAEYDTKVGLVRVVLLIEDSAQYYSKYLPAIYSVLFDHVGEQIVDYEMNELEKIARMRSRAKLLWARNYEQANYLYSQYKDFVICVISDAEFVKGGEVDSNSGREFLSMIRAHNPDLPILIQSSEVQYAQFAKEIHAQFVNKNSDLLLTKIRNFTMKHIGYGDFVFRNSKGEAIGSARNVREFETMLRVIPDESYLYHAAKNQFSIWLMGRGEVDLALKLHPVHAEDFADVSELRSANLQLFDEYTRTKKQGKILGFDEIAKISERSIVALTSGSLGGKGRGLAFVNALINNFDFNPFPEKITICTPKTAIIGTDEYERFMRTNCKDINLFAKDMTDAVVKQHFVKGEISEELRMKLRALLEQIHRPIAVRSSSIFEDSVNMPIAGIYSTYIVPNNSANIEQRLQDLELAIRLIYASVYSDEVKSFYRNSPHKLTEEKMAVVLQELVGDYYEQYFYPHMSGVAQSYNFYPVSYMKPEDGFAVSAVGLGFYIVDGGKAFRFSPSYPKIDTLGIKELLASSQQEFWAVDFNKANSNYMEDGERAALSVLPLEVAERHKSLTHMCSVYDYQNDRIEAGLSAAGPRVVNFADILKHDYAPVAQTIELLLHHVQLAMGMPVEIEFSVNLSPNEQGVPSFYLLQIKPLMGSMVAFGAVPAQYAQAQKIVQSSQSMGNGIVEHLYDVIYVEPEQFDTMRTLEMQKEIETLNEEMLRQGRKYILIGPGRWGTSDRFLGIPVAWTQISNAQVVVEISLSDFPLEASLGSHFFHNITSMNIGYSAITQYNEQNFVAWKELQAQQCVKRTQFFRHVRFEKPLLVHMNGKHRELTIYTYPHHE
ncbi:MAG: pyruvate, phosphate dikinase [Bacteroidales bacterium]|jgi:CheY-like chemotaxis protein|nr:pyruvate, phosphate dikinase [Bacteroidales bacterium]